MAPTLGRMRMFLTNTKIIELKLGKTSDLEVRTNFNPTFCVLCLVISTGLAYFRPALGLLKF